MLSEKVFVDWSTVLLPFWYMSIVQHWLEQVSWSYN